MFYSRFWGNKGVAKTRILVSKSLLGISYFIHTPTQKFTNFPLQK
uniref:Uncharacterized protein n=1 Tax=Siphoviridae sp. ctXZx16 TaxID=2826371 RepID=A0A8S5ML50_9CAUD|nr:MAG TPA: hypothetical protein [Siphoviridae sp. ctXZx16]